MIKVSFEVYIFSRTFKKCELRENMYNANISTFTVDLSHELTIFRSMSPVELIKSPCRCVYFRGPYPYPSQRPCGRAPTTGVPCQTVSITHKGALRLEIYDDRTKPAD